VAIRLKGLTLVPLRVYFKGSVAKVELGLGKGKAEYDKRASIKERDQNREARQALKGRQR
jgi:SsrA-binding protein